MLHGPWAVLLVGGCASRASLCVTAVDSIHERLASHERGTHTGRGVGWRHERAARWRVGATPETLEGLLARHRGDLDEELLAMLYERIEVAKEFEEVGPPTLPWLHAAPCSSETPVIVGSPALALLDKHPRIRTAVSDVPVGIGGPGSNTRRVCSLDTALGCIHGRNWAEPGRPAGTQHICDSTTTAQWLMNNDSEYAA